MREIGRDFGGAAPEIRGLADLFGFDMFRSWTDLLI